MYKESLKTWNFVQKRWNKLEFFIYLVLDKTLKGIQVVCDSITYRFFRALGLRTEHFEGFYLSFNKQNIDIKNIQFFFNESKD